MMHLNYPQSKEIYSLEELRHLVKALGFPRDLIEKNIPNESIKDGFVSVKSFVEICDSRYFNSDLHYTVNMKSGTYNVETLKKCALQVALRVFSFSDLERIRLAFEMYEDFDQRGMRLDVQTIIKALKLCDRVVAPLKLSKKLRRLQVGYKEKGRIQFCEFLDLLSFCDFTHAKPVEISLVGATDKTARQIYCIDRMKDFILPKDELLKKLLDHQYKEEELRYDHPKLKSKFFKENPINTEDFQHQMKAANEDYEQTRSYLKHSTRQIMRSKGGLSTDNVSPKSLSRATSSLKKPRSTTATTVSVNRRLGTPSRQSSVTVATTFKSAPVFSLNVKEKLKPRAHSSPPVVNDTSRRSFQSKVNELKFNIETEEQRWRGHMLGEISRYIYDTEDALERLRKPPPAPGVRRKRTRTRTRPSPKFTKRISVPRPMLPHHHASHCDAIAQGYGDDDHAVTLKRYGERAQRFNRKKSATDNDSMKRGRLLESILHTESCEDDAASEENGLEMSNEMEKLVEECEEPVEEIPRSESEDPSHSFQPPTFNLATKESWRNAKLNEALGALHNDFSKVFIDYDEINKPNSKVKSNANVKDKWKPHSGVGIHSLVPPPPRYELEDTEFEKELKSMKDFTIPVEDLKDYEQAGADWLALRRSIRRIRSRSPSANSSIKQV